MAAVPHLRSSQLSQNAKFSPWMDHSRKTLLETLLNVYTCEMRQPTAEFLLQKEPEIVSSPRVRQQLPEAERPALHPHLRRYLHAVANTTEESTGDLNGGGKSTDSLGRVQSPVCDIVREPGVAGTTAGEERVVAAVGGAVLHYPGEEERAAAVMPSHHRYFM